MCSALADVQGIATCSGGSDVVTSTVAALTPANDNLAGDVALVCVTIGSLTASGRLIASAASSFASYGNLEGKGLMASNLRGNNVSNATPSAGQTLEWDGTQWAPTTPAGGGISQLTSDVLAGPGSGSQSTDVVQLTGQSLFGQPQVVSNANLLMTATDGGASSALVRVGYVSGGAFGNTAVVLSGRRDAGVGGFRAAIGSLPTDPQPGNYLFSADISAKTVTLNVADAGSGNILPMIQTGQVGPSGGIYELNCKSGWAWDRVQQFTTNFTTDPNVGGSIASLVLEALIPAASGGATLTLAQYSTGPYAFAGPTGRFLMVSDVLGTLSVANPLTIIDAAGRQFYVSGQAPSATFTMDQQYQSISLRLVRYDPGGGPVEAWAVMRG